jgi:hypothetical protein
LKSTLEESNMRLERLVSLVLAAAFVVSCSVASAMPMRHNADSISGEWDATFYAQGQATPFTLELKLEGHKITGKVNSAHTGPGTISKGSWAENQLTMTLDFAKHESIAITGSLKDSKLTGEFRTEGFVSKWEAKKKQ